MAAAAFFRQLKVLPRSCGRRCFGTQSGYESAIAELNKEMESVFGESPSPSGIDSTAHQERPTLSVRSSDKSHSLSVTSSEGQQTLSHVNTEGQAAMVDISSKEDSKRIAVASCRVLLGQKAFSLVASNQMAKGDVLNVAKLAGISGAKQTSNLIPLCHNIGLTHIRVDLRLNEKDSSVEIEGEAATTGKTGVEMEAMTAVSVAGLTVYDMCKAASKDIQIRDIRLEHKTGGKSGIWYRNQ